MKYYILGAGPSGLLFAILMLTRLSEEALRDIQRIILVDHRTRYTRDQIVNVSVHILNALFVENDTLVSVLLNHSQHSTYRNPPRNTRIQGPSAWGFARGAGFGETSGPGGTKGPKCGKPMGRIDWQGEYARRRYTFRWDPDSTDPYYRDPQGNVVLRNPQGPRDNPRNIVGNTINNYLLSRQFQFQWGYGLGGIQLPIRRLEDILRSYIFDHLDVSGGTKGLYGFVEAKVTTEFLRGIDKSNTTVVNCTGSPGRGNQVVSKYFGVCKKDIQGDYTKDSRDFRAPVYGYLVDGYVRVSKDVYYLGPDSESYWMKLLERKIRDVARELHIVRQFVRDVGKRGANVVEYVSGYIRYDPSGGYVNLDPNIRDISPVDMLAILGIHIDLLDDPVFGNARTRERLAHRSKRIRNILQRPSLTLEDIATDRRSYGWQRGHNRLSPRGNVHGILAGIIRIIRLYTLDFDKFRNRKTPEDNYYGGLVIFIPSGGIPAWDGYENHTRRGLVTEQNMYRGFLDPGGCHYLAIQLTKDEYMALERYRNDDNILRHLDGDLRHKVVQGFRYFLDPQDRGNPWVTKDINDFLGGPRVLVSLFAYDTTFCLPPYSTVTPGGAQYFVTGDALMRAHFFTGRGIENATFLLTMVLDEINKRYELAAVDPQDLQFGGLLYDLGIVEYIVEYMVREYNPVTAGEYDLYHNSSVIANAREIATRRQVYDAVDSSESHVPIDNDTWDTVYTGLYDFFRGDD